MVSGCHWRSAIAAVFDMTRALPMLRSEEPGTIPGLGHIAAFRLSNSHAGAEPNFLVGQQREPARVAMWARSPAHLGTTHLGRSARRAMVSRQEPDLQSAAPIDIRGQ